METILILVTIQAFVFGAFCSFVAKEKNREPSGWFVLGFLFSLIALLALIAVPKLDESIEETNSEKPKPDWYYHPTPGITNKQKAFRLLLIFLGIVIFMGLVLLFAKH